MTALVLLALGIGVVAVTLPVTVELAVLTAASLLPERKSRGAASEHEIRLTVIIPAHNEELLIGRMIRSLQACPRSPRILAIAHNCSDRTAERAAEAGADVLVYNDPAAPGKGFALRQGFEHAFSEGADAVAVIDADSTVSENFVSEVQEAFRQGAEAVQCRYEMHSIDGTARSQLTGLALRGFNLVRPRGRARLGLSCGILGNGFAISKSIFQQVPYRAVSLAEDLEYHIHLVLAGKRVQFLESASVRAELPVSAAGEATQRSRWEGGRSRTARQWLGPIAGQILRGHFRLIEPFLELAGLPLAYACVLLLLSVALPYKWLIFYSAAAAGVIGFHFLSAAWAGGNFRKDLRLFCRAPGYIAWKICLLPRLFRDSSSKAAWVRTERVSGITKP